MRLETSPTENQLSRELIGAALEVHKVLGPGLLESAYETFLARELDLRLVKFKKQVGLPLNCKDAVCDAGYRLDLRVDSKVIVEVEAVEALTDVHAAQVLTYLKLTYCRLGLLINFNAKMLKDGIKRLVNHLDERE